LTLFEETPSNRFPRPHRNAHMGLCCGEAGHLIEIDSGLKKSALQLESFLRHCGHCVGDA